MALIKCPECGREVSDKAKACIHCGYPIAEIVDKQEVVPIAEPASDVNKQREIEKYNLLGDELRADKKYLAALDCYIKAANLGSAHAQVWAGNMYERGLGVEKDHKEAVKWFQMAANQNHANALNNLALLYQDGKGVEQDYKKAIDLFARAIAKGSVDAIGNLGVLYHMGSAEIQSYPLAVKYYEQAIAKNTNNSTIYNNLAFMYERGLGTATDYSSAEKYYLKAIELGNKTARDNYGIFANNRGVAYTDGNGVAKDYAKAEAYYLQAIKYGNTKAQSNYEVLKRSRATLNASFSTPTAQSANSNNSWLWIIAGILALFLLIGIGSSGDNSDRTNARTCPWCNGTGYNGNGAQTVEEYVFTKTPCKKCGGDGKY